MAKTDIVRLYLTREQIGHLVETGKAADTKLAKDTVRALKDAADRVADIVTGDVVTLKGSREPKMAVNRDQGGGAVEVVWMNGGALQRASVAMAAIEKVAAT